MRKHLYDNVVISSMAILFLVKIISVIFELTYRSVCYPLNSILDILLSVFTTSSRTCETKRSVSFNMDYLFINIIISIVLYGCSFLKIYIAEKFDHFDVKRHNNNNSYMDTSNTTIKE
jgi:hypothetical protein